MMQQLPPRVSIGLPVYNGENYLALAIDSLLGQSYQDFELIVSDNASTDRTEAICRAYAARDARIRYCRETENRGAAWNFNRLVGLAQGEYFKWAAHDDLCAPEWLARCVDVLDRDSSVVLCFTKHAPIDAEGRPFKATRRDAGERAPKREFDASQPHRRYRDVLVHCDWCYEMFGLARTRLMRRTGLQRAYFGGDKMLLAELSLLGRFEEVPEILFYPRQHAGQSSAIPTVVEQQRYVNPAARRRFSCPGMLRFNWGYFLLAVGSPLSFAERGRCLCALAGYLLRPDKWRRLLRKGGRALGFGGPKPLHPALVRAAETHGPAPAAPWQSSAGDRSWERV
ncbi:MAG TPA: glycosyltransferase family 2 protein [Pirellulales bacterium]|jgi:glycosyltransferase involved in cell wall biosynthesis|nr:glycosyltransferase family 2 protein [Pirellulales bacterium]